MRLACHIVHTSGPLAYSGAGPIACTDTQAGKAVKMNSKPVWIVIDAHANVAGVFRSRVKAEACGMAIAGDACRHAMTFSRGDDYTSWSEGDTHIQCVAAPVQR